MTSEAGFTWDAPAPTEHGKQWIEIELDHPVNAWEHEGAGSITWGANLDRLAPLGEEAVSIIREAWDRRGEPRRDKAAREQQESKPVDRDPTIGASVKPGWAEHVERDHYWIHLTLSVPVNERWIEETGENWTGGRLINDGVVRRSVTVEATTDLGRRAIRIVEALHSAHPLGELDEPDRGAWYR